MVEHDLASKAMEATLARCFEIIADVAQLVEHDLAPKEMEATLARCFEIIADVAQLVEHTCPKRKWKDLAGVLT